MSKESKIFLELIKKFPENSNIDEFLNYLIEFFMEMNLIDNFLSFESCKDDLKELFYKYAKTNKQNMTEDESKQFTSEYLSQFKAVNYVVGIDVGGTNTDTVLLEMPDARIISYTKQPTTKDIQTGVINSFLTCLKNANFDMNQLSTINIGTTSFVNAVVQRSEYLNKVTVIRICGKSTRGIVPYITFPESLRARLEKESNGVFYLKGGFNFNGKVEVEELDTEEILNVAECIYKQHLEDMEKINKDLADDIKEIKQVLCIAIIGLFGTVNEQQELTVKKILQAFFKSKKINSTITLSSEVGKIGLIERENATILNSSLRPYAMKAVNSFERAFEEVGYKNPLFFTQNDGTIAESKFIAHFPVFTFAAGPVNSVRGASFLYKETDCIVVDIGGTTADFAILSGGFTRQSSTYIEIGGVRTNFQMPLVDSIGIGGGTIVEVNEENVSVGPQSVGYKLITSDGAMAFGGKNTTLTDIALKLGLISQEAFSSSDNFSFESLKSISKENALKVKNEMNLMIQNKLDLMNSGSTDVPLLVVGGGSFLIDENSQFRGISEIKKHKNFEFLGIANAIGAALNKISVSIEDVFDQSINQDCEVFCKKQTYKAKEECFLKGAYKGLVEIKSQVKHELSYVDPKKRIFKVSTTAVGTLDVNRITKSSINKEDIKKSGNEKFRLEPFNHLGFLNNNKSHIEAINKYGKIIEKDSHQISFNKPNFTASSNLNSKRKAWLLNEQDIDFIAMGATILGCGGGGHPLNGMIYCKNLLRQGKQIKIISPDDIEEDEYVFINAYCGTPDCGYEKLDGTLELKNSFEAMKNYTETKLGKKIDKVLCIPIEIGGANSLSPLMFAGENGYEVVDADFMGRAYPTLNYITPVFYNQQIFPIVFANDYGDSNMITEEQVLMSDSNKVYNWDKVNAKTFEIIEPWSYVAGVSLYPYTKDQIKNFSVKYTLSRARNLGEAIFTAKVLKNQTLMEVLHEKENAKKIFEGMISFVDKNLVGFSKGELIITGYGDFSNTKMKIIFKNEILLAYLKKTNEIEEQCVDSKESQNSSYGELVAAVPDLISILDKDSYEAILVENFSYGLKVVVVAIPSNNILRDNLELTGPKSFGYDIEYKPFSECKNPESFWNYQK